MPRSFLKNRHKLPGGDFAEFVFDFDSLRLPKNPVIVDFNHDEDQVIGKARVYLDEDGLKAAGTLVSTRPGDVAAEHDPVAGTTLDHRDGQGEQFGVGAGARTREAVVPEVGTAFGERRVQPGVGVAVGVAVGVLLFFNTPSAPKLYFTPWICCSPVTFLPLRSK